ncbi:S41 family peptidase [Sphingomonas phyllosphaerae]|uniref:S41 family peptidase n=1 Tax=Sphingomonas phyllosphaerae TaxID=257003 RepID=UPI001EE1BAEA|nr:S41 family peptidase [Sphingomonas phyllosphaerae]
MKRRAVMLALTGMTLSAADAPPPDWAALTRQDVQAFHDQVVANHPGPLNRLDPGFTKRNEASFALARRRAGQVRSYGGYIGAMRGYVASFNDGHLALDVHDAQPLPLAWPGFLTGFDEAGRQVVRTRADDVDLPLGAQLESCDGVAAETLAARNVGAFRGRWQLLSQRATNGGRLFIDAGNPFITRPTRCRFSVEGKVRDVALAWRPLSDAAFQERFAATAPRARPDFASRTLADGTRWYTMPSFDGDPAGDAARALAPMIAAMKRDRAVVTTAPRIVLDLRGNGGGSSDWSQQIAAVLWGQAAADAQEAEATTVDWRASPGNLAAMQKYRADLTASADVSPDAKAWVERVATGLFDAIARRQPLWREPDTAPPARASTTVAPETVPTAKVYVLTDWGCASACLDAVDLWTALGAVQVGQETSADSLYMDVRSIPLPSGFADAVVPMKVYRGRKRGSNVPATPRHAYRGDMRDTAALERWIAALP